MKALSELLFAVGLICQKRYNLRYISCEDDLKYFLSSNFKELGFDCYYRINDNSGGFFEYSDFEVLTKFENRWVFCCGSWGDVLSVCCHVKMGDLGLIVDDGFPRVVACISHHTAIYEFPGYGMSGRYGGYLLAKRKK